MLFEEGDQHLLADIVINIMSDRLLYASVVKKGRKVVEDNFENQAYLNSMYSVFRKLYVANKNTHHG